MNNLNAKKTNNLKVNLHITKACNYSCRYCFAHFRENQDLNLAEVCQLIDNLKASGMVSAINFAGGEPVLHKDFPAIVRYAYEQGFKLSLISNGSLLLNEKLMPRDLFRCFSTLGISVDSFDTGILRGLKCCDCHGNVVDEAKLTALVELARSLNPDVKIKVNTVVSRLNLHEDLVEKGLKLKVDRWKLLRMKPFERGDFSNMDLKISDEEFEAFVERNKALAPDLVPELDLSRSYIIFDNRGNLIDNEGDDYEVVGNGLTESFASLMAKFQLNYESYSSRYVEVVAA